MKVMIRCRTPEFAERSMKILGKYNLELSEDPDILISVGGDGSALHNFKKYKKPVLPVRTPDSQSYVSDIALEDLEKVCENLVGGNIYIEERTMLDAFINEKKVDSAVNDVTLTQVPTQAMRYSVYSDGWPAFGYDKLIGDGVIVATPTGSTAYNRSAGGHILSPDSEKIVVTLKYPVFLESKHQRSKILDENSSIALMFYRPASAFMIVDTNEFCVTNSDLINVKKSDETFDLVRIRGMEESRGSKEKRREEWFKRQSF